MSRLQDVLILIERAQEYNENGMKRSLTGILKMIEDEVLKMEADFIEDLNGIKNHD